MPRNFDRDPIEELSGPFTGWPLLLCPECRGASLEPGIERIASLVAYAEMEDDDEAVPLSGFFHGVLSCPRTSCRNSYVVAGQWKIDDPGEPGSEEMAPVYYYANYIFPALPLMQFPDDVPDKIRDPVAAASLVLLSDASAAANRIRSAIEALLDCQGIRKFPPRDRSHRLTTHARIEQFRKRNPRAAEHLMAMKWIGNMGSHERELLPLSIVLDGIEHFALALEIIYDSTDKALDRRAAMINQRGGRLRPPKVANT